MTHPTDDELESMAQYWTDQMAKAVVQDAMLAAEKFSQTAAMLRACKTGDAPDKGECMHPFCGDRCGEKTKKGQTND